MSRTLSLALITFVCVAATSPRTREASLCVCAPLAVHELDDSLDFCVSGIAFGDATPTFRVLDGDNDITSVVTITTLEESREVEIGDDPSEYSGTFHLDLDDYRACAGDSLRVLASVATATGAVRAESTTEVLSHVQAYVDDTIEAGSTDIHVAVITTELGVRSQAIVVRLNGRDVTSEISIMGPELAAESVDDRTTPVFVHDRMQRYWLDISPLGSDVRGSLSITVTVRDESWRATSATAEAQVVAADPSAN